MSTNFPTSLDTHPSAGTLASHSLATDTHATLHGNLGDAIDALEAKVGIDSSAVTSSLDYRIGHSALSTYLGKTVEGSGAPKPDGVTTVPSFFDPGSTVYTDGGWWDVEYKHAIPLISINWSADTLAGANAAWGNLSAQPSEAAVYVAQVNLNAFLQMAVSPTGAVLSGQAVVGQTNAMLDLRTEAGVTNFSVGPTGYLNSNSSVNLFHPTVTASGAGFTVQAGTILSTGAIQAQIYGYHNGAGKNAAVVYGGDRLDLLQYGDGVLISVNQTAPSDASMQDSRSNETGGAVIGAYLNQAGNALIFKVLYNDGTTFKTGQVALT